MSTFQARPEHMHPSGSAFICHHGPAALKALSHWFLLPFVVGLRATWCVHLPQVTTHLRPFTTSCNNSRRLIICLSSSVAGPQLLACLPRVPESQYSCTGQWRVKVSYTATSSNVMTRCCAKGSIPPATYAAGCFAAIPTACVSLPNSLCQSTTLNLLLP